MKCYGHPNPSLNFLAQHFEATQGDCRLFLSFHLSIQFSSSEVASRI